MRFEFYFLESGENATVRLRNVNTAQIEALRENARQQVNERFQQLITNVPDIGSIVVVSPSMGEPPGVVVATELVHSWTREICEQSGKPFRSLAWVVDPATGLV